MLGKLGFTGQLQSCRKRLVQRKRGQKIIGHGTSLSHSLASQTLQSQGKGGSGDFACSELSPWNSIITRYVTGNRKCFTARDAHAEL